MPPPRTPANWVFARWCSPPSSKAKRARSPACTPPLPKRSCMPGLELSKKARTALGTILRMEGFDGPVGARTDTLGRVVAVLERAGVEFLDDDKPGVRLRGPKK